MFTLRFIHFHQDRILEEDLQQDGARQSRHLFLSTHAFSSRLQQARGEQDRSWSVGAEISALRAHPRSPTQIYDLVCGRVIQRVSLQEVQVQGK